MTVKNPVSKGRMYRVSDGGSIKGIRFRKDGKVEVLVQPKAKSKANRKKKVRPNKKRKNTKPRSRKSIPKKRANKKRSIARKNTKRKAAKKKK